MSHLSITTAAIAAAAAFVAYCIYFDYKRRSSPDYKQKIREARRAAAEKKTKKPMANIRNATEMQAFFLQEVQLGEEMISEGQVDDGIEHLCNAITLCGQPQQLLQVFQQTLPSEHFSLLIQKLPEARERIMEMVGSSLTEEGTDLMKSAPAHNFESAKISELIDNDDLE